MARLGDTLQRHNLSNQRPIFLQYYHNSSEREPIERDGDNSPRKKHKKLDTPISDTMLLIQCREALGLTPEQVLDSSYILIMALLGEYEYVLIAKNNAMYGSDEDDEDYVTMVDFDSGESVRVKRVDSV